MVVTTRCDLAEAPVLSVGQENVLRYFPERVPSIELQLGGLQIRCRLAASFWQNRPEIRDARLRDWLRFSVYHKRPCRKPVLLELVPVAKNKYLLRALPAGQMVAAHADQGLGEVGRA